MIEGDSGTDPAKLSHKLHPQEIWHDWTGRLFWHDWISEEVHSAYGRFWLLQAIERIEPATTQVFDGLRNKVLSAYKEAYQEWRRSNPKSPLHRAIPCGPGLALSPVQEELQDAIRKLQEETRRWAQSWNLTYKGEPPEWLLEQVEVTLHLWMRYPYLTDLPQWPGIHLLLRRTDPRGYLEKIPVNSRESEKEFIARAKKARREWLKEQHLKPSAGIVRSLVPIKSLDPDIETIELPPFVEWFVQFQICGKSKEEISLQCCPRYRDLVANMRSQMKQFAMLIGLTLRHEKRGRHPRSFCPPSKF
jgi:hypothetical protein